MPLKLVHLTQPISSQMPVYPGDPKPELKSLTDFKMEGYRLSQLKLATHCGTHVDAPAHILEKGKYLDSYSPEKFAGPAVKISCGNKIISADEIHSQLPKEINFEFLLLETNWDIQWGTAEYFSNSPRLSGEAAELLASLPLKGLGMDFSSVDDVENKHYTNHNILLGRDILLIENLCNLNRIPYSSFLFSCQPLFQEHADGSPVIAMAIISTHNE